MVFGKEVTLQTHGLDKYKRTLADVLLPDGTHVNHTLVKDGMCWWYRKYAPGDTVLGGLENEAREAWKGFWADTRPPATVGKKEIAESPAWLRNTTISPILPSRLVSLRRHAHRLTPSPNRAVVLIPPGEVNNELCPNEKMVDVSRLSNVHGCVGMDKSFQS
jgi:hypothetical protein